MERLKQKVISEEEKGKEQNVPAYESNKFVLKNVMKKYKHVISSLFASLLASTNSTSNNSIALTPESGQQEPQTSSNTEQNLKLNKLSLPQMNEVFLKLGFISQQTNQEKESLLKQQEKKLSIDIFEAIKDSDGLANVDHLFLIVLSVINLYEYYLYSSYKIANKNLDEKKEEKPKPKINKEEVLAKISTEVDAKIVKNGRYVGFDQEGNLLITFPKAKMINRDFNLFYINFMTGSAVNLSKKPETASSDNEMFKPKINENSEKLYDQYRKRVYDLENSNENLHKNQDKKENHTEYIDKLILKKKKQEKVNAKIKQEFKDKELEGCSFQPKINDDYKPDKELIEVEDRSNRWEKLHKMGIQIITNKKDKPRNDIDHEIHGKECTFKPKDQHQPIKEHKKIKNDIYTEKSYELLYSRLKGGRVERLIKDSVHQRGEFPQEIDEYLKKTKPKGTRSVSPKSVPVPKESPKPKPAKVKIPVVVNTSEKIVKVEPPPQTTVTNPVDDPNEHFNDGPERKDSIPLLIIDVNIRPGVKKKIYVFDGDTAEGLAEKFSSEHNLDGETKSKLQVLIHSHMSRLLMRIPEETHSVSEKSSTYNLS